jgi:hypothetical protein
MNESRAVVVERWWHRLLHVISYGLTLLILCITLLIQVEEAEYYTYSYSFQPDYKSSTGDQFKCYSYDSLKTISCGEFSDGEAFMKYYLAITGEDKVTNQDGEKTTPNQIFADLRAKEGRSDSDIAVSLIGKNAFSYRREQHWNTSKLLIAVAVACGITFGSFVALLGLYKVVLFVVHGHTRIVRK